MCIFQLLAKEIRKERNEILQCVYHIVRHNFFEDRSRLTRTVNTENSTTNSYTGNKEVLSTSEKTSMM